MTTAIILAAGKSTRMGAKADKAFLSLIGKPVVAWSLMAFERTPEIDKIVLVVRKDQLDASKAVVKMFGISKIQAIVQGGTRRQDSVLAGIAACDLDTKHIVIHDGARPLVTPELISEVVAAVKKSGAVTVGRPMIDTVKKCAKAAIVSETVDRDKLWLVQTPQAFLLKDLRAAYKNVDGEITDDCKAIEDNGGTVKIVQSLKPNFKITTIEDFELVSKIMK
ncbi:MAG: 2-C-methyl-D-erythritol 4-phosphate cytidylyltransferase [Kiritimatiellae bacterium]|nr:2-C-methyl-D-erythritol 4-phosphate cytidylyltransferase [Kiritimatiellia bacterium]